MSVHESKDISIVWIFVNENCYGSTKCHYICLQCAIDNMSVFVNMMALSCAGAKSETMLPMFCDSIYGVM